MTDENASRAPPEVQVLIEVPRGSYAKCKGLLNLVRRRPGRNACEGWCDVQEAIARARPRDAAWRGPPVPF